MPLCIKRSVQQQNIRFLHTRSQYTEEYFKFIRNIATVNAPNMVTSSSDLQQIQIVSNIFMCFWQINIVTDVLVGLDKTSNYKLF